MRIMSEKKLEDIFLDVTEKIEELINSATNQEDKKRKSDYYTKKYGGELHKHRLYNSILDFNIVQSEFYLFYYRVKLVDAITEKNKLDIILNSTGNYMSNAKLSKYVRSFEGKPEMVSQLLVERNHKIPLEIKKIKDLIDFYSKEVSKYKKMKDNTM